MNIFKILASGGNNLKETNVSAFLGYLLDPKADHGLGSGFLELFLESLIKKYKIELRELLYKNKVKDLSHNLFDIEVVYEKAIEDEREDDVEEDEENKGRKNRTSVVDIIIKISKRPKANRSLLSLFKENEPIGLILIENKINTSSFTGKQLIKQYDRTIDFLQKQSDDKETFKILKEKCFSIYVTPDEKKYGDELNNFIKMGKKGEHIKWKTKDTSSECIVLLLENLITNENGGKIDPLQEYTKHTIKAFINFIKSDFKSALEEKIEGKGIPKYFNSVEESLKYQKEIKNIPDRFVKIGKDIDGWISTLPSDIGKRYSPSQHSYYLSGDAKDGERFAVVQFQKNKIVTHLLKRAFSKMELKNERLKESTWPKDKFIDMEILKENIDDEFFKLVQTSYNFLKEKSNATPH